MTDDLVKRLRGPQSAEVDYATRHEGADRIDTLTAQLESTLKDRAQIIAERDQWIQHAKNAVWTDSEELKQAEADNARLLKALTNAGSHLERGLDKMAFNIIRRALNTGKEPSHE